MPSVFLPKNDSAPSATFVPFFENNPVIFQKDLRVTTRTMGTDHMKPITEDQIVSLMKGLETREQMELRRRARRSGRAAFLIDL